MRTVVLANNRLGAEVCRYLVGRSELVGVVLNRPERQKYAQSIRGLAPVVWEWPDGFHAVAELAPDCILSVLFSHLVSPEWRALARWRALNLHPGLLPYNRGGAPNVWPLVDGTPAGTSLHEMAETFDTGAVFAQAEVATYPDDTALSLYSRLEATSLEMLRRVWPTLVDTVPNPQVGEGTFHRSAELAQLDLTDTDLAVVDKIRARTFPPYGAEFVRDGMRYRVRIEIERVESAGGAVI